MKIITPHQIKCLKLLQLFATERSSWYMPVATARTYDQRSFRSVLAAGWIAFHRILGDRGGFRIADAGREAWMEYITTDILRSEAQASRPLTAYFDPKAYGLRVVKGKKPAA